MAALIGLFAGAWIGYLLWQDWGAAICGIAGFFAGARVSAWRAKATRGGSPVAASGSVPSARQEGDRTSTSTEAALLTRVKELERRVATLERGAARDAEPVGYALRPEPPDAAADPSLTRPAPSAMVALNSSSVSRRTSRKVAPVTTGP